MSENPTLQAGPSAGPSVVCSDDSRTRRSWAVAWFAVLVPAFVPFTGRWLILAVVLPALVSLVFYRSIGADRRQMALAGPAGGWVRCIRSALLWAVLLWALKAFVVQPLSNLLFAAPKNLAMFDPIKGSLGTLLVFLVSMWLIAAFGEEFVWRGFLLRTAGDWLRMRVPRSAVAWSFVVLACATLWALTHAYQGPRGVFERLIGGTILGTIYVRGDRSSLWLVVLIHGIGNSIAFVAIYFDAYSTIFPFS